MSDKRKKYETLKAAAEREPDPILKHMLEARRDSAQAEWLQESSPQGRMSREPGPDALTGAVEAAQPKSFASTVDTGDVAPPGAPPSKAAGYPAFDADRDAYFRAEAAKMGKPLAPALLSSKPEVAGVQQEVQPTAPPAAPQAQQERPLEFGEFKALFGGGGGGRGMQASLRGAQANAGAAGAAADEASAAERDAILARGAQQESAGKQLGETMAQFAQSLKAKDEEHAAYLAQARERIGGLINESKVAAEEFRAATREQGFMQSLSSGGRVGAAISLALGALGGGLTGQGGNAALDVLKFRVDEDLRNRALNISAKGQALDAVDGLLQRNLQIFGDEVSAREATRAAIFDALDLEVKRQVAISGGVDANLHGQQISAGLLAEKKRSEEVLANQQLQAVLKAARSGGGMNDLKLFKEWQQYLKNDVGIQTDAEKLAAMRNPKDDLGSEEGKRAADRKHKTATLLEPIDTALDYANTLLTKGVPNVATRAAFAAGAPMPAENVEQMAALGSLTRNTLKAIEDGRLTDQDAVAAKKELLIQGPLTSQEALTRQIRTLMGILQRSRERAMSVDAPASAAYDAEVERRNGAAPAPSGGTGVPSYGRSF